MLMLSVPVKPSLSWALASSSCVPAVSVAGELMAPSISELHDKAALISPSCTSVAVAASVIAPSSTAITAPSDGLVMVTMRASDVAALKAAWKSDVHVQEPVVVNIEPEPVDDVVLSAGTVDLPTVTNAAAWHAAGHRGRAVKVGIVDYFDDATWDDVEGSGGVPSK